MEHYLDNSATTVVSQKAAEKAFEVMLKCYGNPSSLHAKGLEAEKELELARNLIARAIGCESDRLFFTSGGTEANNTAVFGACQALKKRGNKIVVSAVEHSSILEAVKELENRGFSAEYIAPEKDGIIPPQKVADAVDDSTVLVSVMTTNNELGAVNDISAVVKAVRKKKSSVIIHTDAVQAFGKIPVKAKKSDVDLLTVSAHKIHGPKGVGALYIKKGVRIVPLHFGGEQEKKIRPGTEALPLICAFGEAVGEFNIDENYQKVKELNLYARKKLSAIGGVVINSGDNALPYILNISVRGIRSETMLHFLEQNEIYVSSGSACAKGKPSHVLSAVGINRDLADSALRISFSKFNNKGDIDALAECIEKGCKSLVKKI